MQYGLNCVSGVQKRPTFRGTSQEGENAELQKQAHLSG